MEKLTLKYIGNGYRGRDHVTGQEVLCTNGADVAVSAEKAAQLLKDFPKNFSRVGEAEAPKPQEDKVLPPEPKIEEQPKIATSSTGIGYSVNKPKETKLKTPRKSGAKKSGKRK